MMDVAIAIISCVAILACGMLFQSAWYVPFTPHRPRLLCCDLTGACPVSATQPKEDS